MSDQLKLIVSKPADPSEMFYISQTATFGVVHFLISDRAGGFRTVSGVVDLKYREEILKFMKAHNNQLEDGEWEAFYDKLRGLNKYKIVKFVKEIITEINGRSIVRGIENAKGEI